MISTSTYSSIFNEETHIVEFSADVIGIGINWYYIAFNHSHE